MGDQPFLLNDTNYNYSKDTDSEISYTSTGIAIGIERNPGQWSNVSWRSMSVIFAADRKSRVGQFICNCTQWTYFTLVTPDDRYYNDNKT